MPNISPLVTHMANNQQLYASAGASGASVTLNNTNVVSTPALNIFLVKDTPVILATNVVPANYGSSSLSVIPYAQFFSPSILIKSTSTALPGDTLTFNMSVSDGITTTTLFKSVVVDATTLANFTLVPLIASNYLGSYAQGSWTFTFRLGVTYSSSGSAPFNLTTSTFLNYSSIVAGVKPF